MNGSVTRPTSGADGSWGATPSTVVSPQDREWIDRLHLALDGDGFVIHLQPIRNLATDEVEAAELLIRLSDGAGLVTPDQFISVAKRSGLVPQIDAWVIRNGLPLLRTLRRLRPGFKLTINLSAASVGSGLVDQAFAEMIDRVKVRPGELIVELTETASLRAVPDASSLFYWLQNRGVEVAIDDFGAGFGSLRYLKDLLVDWIKIDGEFIGDLDHSARSRTILRAIAQLADSLGVRTVAEWVSSEETLRAVRDLGIGFAQGFHIGAPVPLEEFFAVYLAPGSADGDTTQARGRG